MKKVWELSVEIKLETRKRAKSKPTVWGGLSRGERARGGAGSLQGNYHAKYEPEET